MFGHVERWRFKESTSGIDHRGRALAQINHARLNALVDRLTVLSQEDEQRQ